MSLTDEYLEQSWNRDAVTNFLSMSRRDLAYAFSVFDVTDTFERISSCQRELGIAISLHGVAIYCLAQAAALHPDTLTYRYRDRLITFKNADITTTMLKRLPDGSRHLALYTFRGAQHKTMAQIQWELRTAMRTPLLERPPIPGRLGRLTRRFLYWRMQHNPFLFNKYLGNLIVTTTQSQGLVKPFYAMAPSPYTLSLLLGSVTEETRLNAQNQPVVRKLLHISGASDHAIIDGHPVSRFTLTLAKLFESAAGLDADFVAQMQRYLAGENHE
ncbi:MAG: 2-oxo acid dehydrogenase subunit E2 [Methylobacter sp.]